MALIRNELFDLAGVVVSADVIDVDAGTFTREEAGVVVSTRVLTADEVALYTLVPPPPSAEEQLQAARDALAVLDVIEAPVTAADLADVLVDVKTALGG